MLKTLAFWSVAAVVALYATQPQAEDETLTMSVVSSTPYYGKNRQYTKHCWGSHPHECEYIGAPPQYFMTIFQDGQRQIKMLTQVQFPQDIWFDITQNCDTGSCYYKRAIPSGYQSPETLAIDEILKREQIQYLLNPNRLY